MKFHLIRCDAHGWAAWDAEPPLPKDEHKRLECRGGHFFTADTRNLSIYEADQKDIPDKIGPSDYSPAGGNLIPIVVVLCGVLLVSGVSK
jgi:hypothetical protein